MKLPRWHSDLKFASWRPPMTPSFFFAGAGQKKITSARVKLWWWWTIIVLPLSGESIGWYGRVYNIYYKEYNICRSYVCIFLHHAIEILYILLICMNILNANYIILLYCTTSFSDIAPRRQALTFACLDRCSPSRHTAGSRNNVANMHVCFAGHMFQGRITSKRQCMHA